MAKLLEYQIMRGIIYCETGLKIGGTKDTLEIGGLDNPVIKHPISGMPYIPGSSLKGKLRSLLEIKEGKFEANGSPYGGKDRQGREDLGCHISRLFGPHKNTRHNFGPTRLIVRDAKLAPEWEQRLRDRKREFGNGFLEIKQETSIDRKIGVAAGGTLRTQERVPEGTEFRFEIVLRNFDWGLPVGDEKEINLQVLTGAMRMLENDYLGGSGSRGYGQIRFRDITINGEPYELY